MIPELFIQTLQSEFELASNPPHALRQQAYMRHQFTYLGLTKPHRSRIEKPLFKKYPLNSEQELIHLLDLLWQKEAREYQYTALELAYHYRKKWPSSIVHTFERMIRNKSWWDTVDDIAANLLGHYLRLFPEQLPLMDVWVHDPYLWIRRSALIFQLHWKQHTDEKRLFTYCEKLMGEKDFFIRKAIGWALRQYSKTNPQSVKGFIEQHRNGLSPLSVREGSKYLP